MALKYKRITSEKNICSKTKTRGIRNGNWDVIFVILSQKSIQKVLTFLYRTFSIFSDVRRGKKDRKK